MITFSNFVPLEHWLSVFLVNMILSILEVIDHGCWFLLGTQCSLSGGGSKCIINMGCCMYMWLLKT